MISTLTELRRQGRALLWCMVCKAFGHKPSEVCSCKCCSNKHKVIEDHVAPSTPKPLLEISGFFSDEEKAQFAKEGWVQKT